jgi:predicted metal-dependent phosphoesterase TrpH
MPGYEPFLLCDFHVHTTWSDGRLSLRDVVNLYGQTGRFDVIAITDHILMERDLLKRAGRLLSLGRRHFSVTQERFDDYLAEVAFEAKRARKMYDLLVIPGAEITQNHFRSRKNSHIIALNIEEWISGRHAALREELERHCGGVARERRRGVDALPEWLVGGVVRRTRLNEELRRQK